MSTAPKPKSYPSALLLFGVYLLSWLSMYALYTKYIDLDWLYASRGIHAYLMISKSFLWHFGKFALWPSIVLALELGLIAMLSAVIAPLVSTSIWTRQAQRINILAAAPILLGILASCIRILWQGMPAEIATGNIFILNWQTLLQFEPRGALELFAQVLGPLSLVSAFVAVYLFHTREHASPGAAVMLGALPHLLAVVMLFLLAAAF